jgi:hypothetical protein
MKNTLLFRARLRKVGLLAYLNGKLSREDWKLLQDVIRRPRRKTKTGEEIDILDEVAEDCVCELQAQGKIDVNAQVGEIDWSSLLEFIKELLPVIMEFIKMLLPLFA